MLWFFTLKCSGVCDKVSGCCSYGATPDQRLLLFTLKEARNPFNKGHKSNEELGLIPPHTNVFIFWFRVILTCKQHQSCLQKL